MPEQCPAHKPFHTDYYLHGLREGYQWPQRSLVTPHEKGGLDAKQGSPICLAPGTSLMEDNFSMDWERKGDVFGMIQGHYIYCALYFYYSYISSTSDHQALDLGGRGPLMLRTLLGSFPTFPP